MKILITGSESFLANFLKKKLKKKKIKFFGIYKTSSSETKKLNILDKIYQNLFLKILLLLFILQQFKAMILRKTQKSIQC